MKTWLISYYGGHLESWGILSIINLENLSHCMGIEKEKFVFDSTITRAIQRLERLSRVNYIDRAKLETCLLSRSTLSSLVRLLPMSEYDLWVREMKIAGLDFKNPVGMEMFICFKRECVIERNTNKGSRSDPSPKEVQNIGEKNDSKSRHKIFQQENDSSGSEKKATAHAMSGPASKPWNPPPLD